MRRLVHSSFVAAFFVAAVCQGPAFVIYSDDNFLEKSTLKTNSFASTASASLTTGATGLWTYSENTYAAVCWETDVKPFGSSFSPGTSTLTDTFCNYHSAKLTGARRMLGKRILAFGRMSA